MSEQDEPEDTFDNVGLECPYCHHINEMEGLRGLCEQEGDLCDWECEDCEETFKAAYVWQIIYKAYPKKEDKA